MKAGGRAAGGRAEIDRHRSLKEALHHLRSLAPDLGEDEVFVHPILGQVYGASGDAT